MKRMRTSFFAVLSAGLIALAWGAQSLSAQNSICPTATIGDSTNKCASTKFVQQAIGAPGTVVNSFNGRTGAVTPQTNDYSFPQISGTAGLGQGGLGASQSAATANQIPVFPGAGGGAAPTSVGGAGGFFDTICSSTIGQGWVRLTGGWGCSSLQPASVVYWGAKCDGTTNDTTAINTALVSGATWLYIPGTCNVTSLNSPPANVRISGGNKFTSIIQTTSGTVDVWPISNQNVKIDNLGFASSVTRTAGNYLNITASSVTVDDYYMNAAFHGITVADGANIVRLDKGYIFQTSATGIGIQLGTGTATGPCDFYLGHTLINATASATRNNVVVSNLCDGTLEAVQAIAANNLVINPTTGQAVSSLYSIGSFFDSAPASAVSINFVPTGSGVITRISFTRTWCAGALSTSAFCVQFAPAGTSVIDGVDYTGGDIVNGAISVVLSQAAGTTLKDINFNGNRLAGATTACFFISGLTSGLIENNIAGTPGSLAACNIGVDFSASPTITRLSIVNNDFTNSSSALSGLSTVTSSHLRITDNQGYNPVGLTAGTSTGVSTSTITAGPSPETHYITQSANFNAVVKSGVTSLCTVPSATVPCVIQLGPNEAYTVTWTTTQPTYSKFVH